MSHFNQRKETNCLNCNAEVTGRYCSICGQENVPPRQSFGHLLSHIFNDITHFDGKFFSTLSYLIRRPGYLTTEYVRGRRTSYLDPIRMYLFTSAIFLLILFKILGNNWAKSKEEQRGTEAAQALVPGSDSLSEKSAITKQTDSLHKSGKATKQVAGEDSVKAVLQQLVQNQPNQAEQYDSVQNRLPPTQRDGWLMQKWRHQISIIGERSSTDKNFGRHFVELLLHRLPQLLFVSLPFFALVLKLLYYRHPAYYYTDHGIFTIHLYNFTFINLLTILLIGQVSAVTGWKGIVWLNSILLIWTFVYLYKAMRNFYGQRRGKTILKFVLLNIASFFILSFLLIFFLFLNLLTIE